LLILIADSGLPISASTCHAERSIEETEASLNAQSKHPYLSPTQGRGPSL